MTNKQKVIHDATKKKSKLFFGLPVRIGPLPTEYTKINNRFIVIHGKPSAIVTLVDLTTDECAVFHDLTAESIQSVVSLTNDVKKCVKHICHFTDKFATLSGLKIEE